MHRHLLVALALLLVNGPALAQAVGGGRDHHSGRGADAGSTGSRGGGAGNNGAGPGSGGGTGGGGTGGGTGGGDGGTGGGGTGGGGTGGGGTGGGDGGGSGGGTGGGGDGGGGTGGGGTGGGGTGGGGDGGGGGGSGGGGSEGGGGSSGHGGGATGGNASGGDSGGSDSSGGGDSSAGGGDSSGGGESAGGDSGAGDGGEGAGGEGAGTGTDSGADSGTGTGTDAGAESPSPQPSAPNPSPAPSDPSPAPSNPSRPSARGPGGNSHGGAERRSFELVWMDPTTEQLSQAGIAGFTVREGRLLTNLNLRVVRLGTPRGMSYSEARRRLERIADARRIDVNAVYRPQASVALPSIDYARARIGWGEVKAGCGAGARIGVIDSALPPGVLAHAEIGRAPFGPKNARPSVNGHGAAVLGLILGDPAQRVPGLLPAARVELAEAFYQDDAGGAITDAFTIATALDWLAARGLPVANMSFTGPDNSLLATAVERLNGRMLLVAAAGNDGGPVGYPAAYPGVLAVTAVDKADAPYPPAARGPQLALAAPGVDLWTLSASGKPGFQSGTSLAAPFVSAAAAVRLARGGTPADVRAALTSGARDIGAPGHDDRTGHGLVQAEGCR